MERVGLLVAYSLVDPAGSGAASVLADLLGLERVGRHEWRGRGLVVAGFEADVLYLDVIEERFDPHEIIVLSRHSGRARVKSFTVHHTGNPGPRAAAGGRPRELGVANPPRARQILYALSRAAEATGASSRGFEVSLEATHHGPTSLRAPLVFAEIGSSMEEWRDPLARRVLAEAVAEAVEHRPPECTSAAGFGGGHYARKHTTLMLSSKYCYGHIYAKYVFREGVSPDIIRMAFTRSQPEAVAAIIEKKGLRASHRKKIEDVVEDLDINLLLI